MRARLAVLVLFFISGVSGLVDQVVWVRHVSLAFGSTAQSAALVTSVFVGGLGLGAWVAGGFADRRGAAASLRAYAMAELAICVFGVALAFILPWLAAGGLGGSYTVAANGWHTLAPTTRVMRAVVVAALLGPSALCMGATLSLLVRAVVDVREAGWWVGWLFGVNTLGAAVGALATDLWLVPSWGLRGALLFAASLNGLAAVGALLLRPEGEAEVSVVAVGEQPALVAAALFVAGFAAMGMELAWFRFLSGALGPYRAVFSALLTVLLVGLVVGSVGAGALSRRFGNPVRWFAGAQLALGTLVLLCFAAFDPEDIVRRQLGLIPVFLQDGVSLWPVQRINLVTAAGLVFLPSVAMGASFPLGNAMAQDSASSLGRRAGLLYLATTAGNVVGALVVGFAMLPGLGLQRTVMALAALACLAPLFLGREGRWAAIGLVAVLGFARLPPDQLLWASFPANRVEREGVLAVHEGVEQIVVVTGRPEGPARLWTGGHPMTSTSPHAQRYMRLMAHIPLLMQDEPERVAVICFGVGNTLSAAALHPSVRELHAIDLSWDVLSHGSYFEHANHGVLRDPRLSVFVNDGRHHLKSVDTRYDVITLEPPPIGHAGISALYSVEFYEAARERLSEGGVLTQWLPAYQVTDASVRQMVAAFAEVFPESALLVASGREFVLVGSTGASFSLHDVDQRIAGRPAVRTDLEAVGAPTARELAILYGGRPRRGVALVDDWPILEYSQQSHVMETSLPPELFEPSGVYEWCSDCDKDASLTRMFALTSALYRTDDFLEYSNLLSPRRTSSFDWHGEGEAVDALAQSPSLLALLHAPDALIERALWLRTEGHASRAEAVLEAAAVQAPDDTRVADLREAWALE
ncbi:MAG: hypothetical protein KC912_10470 [Proteobacteria bacterium]|nr:hypothetical protein [Pseudomonadota bacterium]